MNTKDFFKIVENFYSPTKLFEWLKTNWVDSIYKSLPFSVILLLRQNDM